MRWNSLVALLVWTTVAAGCRRAESTSAPPPTPSAPAPASGGLTRPLDLSPYGIPGVIDLPEGFKVTRQEASQVALDRDDDPFDLRILPYSPIEPTLQQRRKALQDGEPYEVVVDEAEGYAAWQRSKHPHPMADHKVEVYREVTLGGRKFVACAFISDFRASKQLAERVWTAAKSLRPK